MGEEGKVDGVRERMVIFVMVGMVRRWARTFLPR